MKKLLYVSGKYSDKRGDYFVHEHIEEARRVSAILWALGIPVICPHTNSYHMDGVASYDTFLQGDLLTIERCDGLVALPSYLTSKGAAAEIHHNNRLGHPTFYWPQQLVDIVNFAMPEGVNREKFDMAFQLTRGDESAQLGRCHIK